MNANDPTGTTFQVDVTGEVESLRLVHRSGSVTCDASNPYRSSNFGCGTNTKDAGRYEIGMLIFDNYQNRIWPKEGTEGFIDVCSNTPFFFGGGMSTCNKEMCLGVCAGKQFWYKKLKLFILQTPIEVFSGPIKSRLRR